MWEKKRKTALKKLEVAQRPETDHATAIGCKVETDIWLLWCNSLEGNRAADCKKARKPQCGADVDEVELVLKEEKKTISHLLKQLKKEGRHCKVDRFFEPLNE
jgi:hypothetical protein